MGEPFGSLPEDMVVWCNVYALRWYSILQVEGPWLSRRRDQDSRGRGLSLSFQRSRPARNRRPESRSVAARQLTNLPGSRSQGEEIAKAMEDHDLVRAAIPIGAGSHLAVYHANCQSSLRRYQATPRSLFVQTVRSLGKQIAALAMLKWHRHALTRLGSDLACRRDASKSTT